EKISQDKTLEQVKNVACLPGIVEKSIALPDSHQGYGFCVGGVAAFDIKKGIISPGGIGYDINCGVRLLRTNLTKLDFLKKRTHILKELNDNIPSGVGRGSKLKLSDSELDEVLLKGSQWCLEKSYATEKDIAHTENSGMIENSNPKKVSQKAKARGRSQLGTIGAGNHFIEVQFVESIKDEKTANAFHLKKDQIVILIHTGSRGLGHQTCSDYIQKMEKLYGFEDLPDRELACAPIGSDLGKDYLSAMAAAANFAFANRQIITQKIRESFKPYFPNARIEVVYDVAHNIAKFEEFIIDGKKQTLCVHRKGATRSFGPKRKELPEDYCEVGQPVFIPGSMGTSSYVLVGTEKAREVSFASTAHGAGRVWSRTKAKQNLTAQQVRNQLKQNNIEIKAGSEKGLVEEAPEAYKDVDEVVRVSDELGIGKIVARLKPLAVIKG
ncbi:MAG: RtcB family protein, partial [Nanoarchaeota archaeon]|nr:RtcB family protein [Nanoarchaeota archaeon]